MLSVFHEYIFLHMSGLGMGNFGPQPIGPADALQAQLQVNALRAIQQIHQQLEGEHNGVEVPVAPVAPVPAVPALPSTEKEDKEDKDDEDTIAAAKRKDFEDHKNNERLLNILFFWHRKKHVM